MEVSREHGDWYVISGAPAKVIEYLRRSVPSTHRYFREGWWYVHTKYVENVKQLAASAGVITDTDPYAVLHLRPTAPPAIIKVVWRELAKTLHPDHGGDEEQFKIINAAYEKITKG